MKTFSFIKLQSKKSIFTSKTFQMVFMEQICGRQELLSVDLRNCMSSKFNHIWDDGVDYISMTKLFSCLSYIHATLYCIYRRFSVTIKP